MSPLGAAVLSAVLPGLGQLANGERAKGLAVLASSVGVIAGIAVAAVGPLAMRSWITVVMLVVMVPFVWVPAVVDAWRRAQGEASPLLEGERIWYVLLLLATVGPMSLPLLWQSPRFSRLVKILLTVAVIGIALAAIAFAVWVGPILERELGGLLVLPLVLGGIVA